ncbi:MAG: glycosyltransferase [Ignavibacteriales bacterium]|nr:hypothetical protein [Gammaproteobacteria bacterium]MCZ2267230.1 glycosyltransferase [Ignavibacteriales bacterium]
MTTVSVITPWLDASELTRVYERSIEGAQAVVIDNGSDLMHAEQIEAMVSRLQHGSIYIRNENNRGFAAANNQGLTKATGDIVVFMNNDVECRPNFLELVKKDVQPGALYGPSKLYKHGLPYLEGWCIAARREVWDRLDGWDDRYYSGLYWEDNDLCFRAVQAGFGLIKTTWPAWHFNNYTTRRIPGSTDHSLENERLFLQRVQEWGADHAR